uniref:RIMS-binding protein 2 n=1 Tax=Oncorhynchus tshawytscha TaxID=74940 RepID=A0A8C8GP11_ONCTS
MREAAERRQQLELEHEQALAVLNAKQQEIDLLQQAQVEAKKEHEGAVHLLEAKVRELEEKCRTQSEQFNLLSKELEKFRLQTGKFDTLGSGTDPLTVCESPGSPNKSLSQLFNGLAAPTGKGNESPLSRSVISEFIRPLQICGDKPELVSVKPTFLTRSSSRTGSSQRMDKELSSKTRTKKRFTGKVRLCIARYSYNPCNGPNEHPEAELPLVAGKYLYVYGTMDDDGFYEGELLDGQQGLVPSNFVDFVKDEKILSSTLTSLGSSSLGMDFLGSMGSCSNGTGTLDVSIDEIGENIVPYPRRINLIKQLAKSVIVCWDPPVVPPGWGSISGYNVLVDNEVRMSVPFGGKTKSLIEKLNLATNTYRISVQSITERGPSDELRCTLLVGKDVVVAPYYLRVDNITQVSAELSWQPSNSNYSHTIFLNEAEYDMVKAGAYKYQFFQLKPMTVYKVKAVARTHQIPWQMPLEHRDKREISVEFCTQPAGPPFPPQEVQVQLGQNPGVLQVRWKPPLLTPTGTSNGANVIGYAVCTKGQKIAEVMYPTADYVTVELNRIQCLEAREVIVRTLSAQGESQDSPVATIPHNILRPPHHSPHHRSPPYPMSKPNLVSARESETKEYEAGLRPGPPWERSPSPLPPIMRGHTLEPPHFQGRRSPSPQRILPQPQGAPIPNTIAKAMAREAAQRVFAENNRMEKRNIFSERSVNSDEEEDGYISPHTRRRGASVDDFLRGSELGRHHHYSHSEEYQTESSRGSDLSDIMEEDEDDLYSEMQLEEGRRRSINSHNTLKERDCWDLQREVVRQKSLRSKRLHSIPEVAEDEPDGVDGMGHHHQRLRFDDEGRPGTPCMHRRSPRIYQQDPHQHNHLSPSKNHRRLLQRQHSSPRYGCNFEERSLNRPSRQTTKSPDSGLDCGSEEEGSLGYRGYPHGSPMRGHVHYIHCEGPVERRALAAGRKRQLIRQCSMDENHCDSPKTGHMSDLRYREVHYGPGREWEREPGHSPRHYPRDGIIGNSPSHGCSHGDRLDHSGRRPVHGGNPPQRRPMMVPSIGRGHGRGRRSPVYYEGSEPEDLARIFVALFDYDPLSMSPNPDAADEELPFKEGQIIKVFGDKDTDGFYRAEIRDRPGLIPCNMVSEIQTEDDGMMDQLLKQGFLPLNTPVEKLERNRRSGRQHPSSTRRMVALYDYDPRESSPNVDVEAELTFCAGDVITVFGEIDEDGFHYGELNGHKGLVPSNFLEEVPDDVEVFLTDTQSRDARYPQDAAARIKTKRKKSVHFTP